MYALCSSLDVTFYNNIERLGFNNITFITRDFLSVYEKSWEQIYWRKLTGFNSITYLNTILFAQKVRSM